MPPSLETEIKQKEFANPYVKLMVNLIYTGTWMKNIHSELLKPHKLTGAQFNVLRILQGQHPQPASVNLIIDRMLDKNSNASRLVDKLLEKELVERSVCASDRRKVEVRISKAGMALLKQANKSVSKAMEHVKSLDLKTVNKLNNSLDEIRNK